MAPDRQKERSNRSPGSGSSTTSASTVEGKTADGKVIIKEQSEIEIKDALEVRRNYKLPDTNSSNPIIKCLAWLLGLKKTADLKTVLWLGIYFSVLHHAWNVHYESSWAYCIFLIAVNAYFSFAGAVIAHNSMHCSLFYNPMNTRVFQMFLSLTYGHPVSTFIPGHNLSHHKFTEHAEDPMRTGKLRWNSNFLNLILFQPTVAGAVLKQDIRYFRLIRNKRTDLFANCMYELVLVAAVQFGLLYLDWSRFLFYWHVPHFFGQWGIVTMNLLQHDGCEVAPPLDKENYNTSRNFVGPLINFLAFNNGYHMIHHVYPSLHWSEIPEAHNKIIKPFCHPNLDQQCMARYIWKTVVYPGKRVTYLGEPHVHEHEEEPEDEDWMKEFYPQGQSSLDYELSAAIILKAITWQAFGSPLRWAWRALAPKDIKVA